MKIGQKITLGFIIIVLPFILTGGIHIANFIKTKSQIDWIIVSNIEELESAEKVFDIIQENHTMILQLLVDAHNKQFTNPLSQAKNPFKSSQGKARTSIDALEKATLNQIENGDPEGEEDELREIQLLKGHVNDFFEMADTITALLEAGEIHTASSHSEERLLPLSLNVQALISDLEMDAKEEIEAALTEARDHIQGSIWTGIIMCLIAVIVAVCLSRYMSRNISTNINKLHAVTGQLGKGKLDSRVDINSRDEIGQIAEDINQMAEGLRSAIVSQEDLAKEVSKRERAIELYKAERNQAQKYLDTVEVIITTLDSNGVITLMNKRGCHILGYDEHEILGKNWFDLCIHEDVRDEIKEVFNKLMAGDIGPVEHYENAVLTKTGEQKMISFHNMVLRNKKGHITGILFSGEDITQYKQSEAALRASEKHTRLLLDSMAEAIYGLDLNGNCTFANVACLKMLGYDNFSELIGKNMHKLMHHTLPDGSPYPEKECRACQAFRTGKAYHVDDEVFWRRKGSSFPVSYWARPIYKDDQISGSVVTFLDITEQIKARNELTKSQKHLRMSLEGTVTAIGRAVGTRDPYTAGHQNRVAEISAAIAHEMGLDEERIRGIYLGASVHDIGKIQTPADLLSKPTKLSAIEYSLIQTHAQAGYDILKDINFPWPIAEIAWQHHERVNGTGYPQGLTGEEMCLEARIVAVADTVEAISSHRPYRPALGIDAALDEIRTKRGEYYDPIIVDACLTVFTEKGFRINAS